MSDRLTAVELDELEQAGMLTKAERLALIATARREAKYREALENLVNSVEPPPSPNCSCHISPPCGDCVEYTALRNALVNARTALEAQ